MLATATDFPHAGSRAFVRGTADPVTIIRRNADETVLVRMDPRPGQRASRDASGNRTLALDELAETEHLAVFGPDKPRQHRRARRRAR